MDKSASPYLFVYGTLLSEGNEFAAYLKQNSRFYGEGRFKGKLFDIGEYPGAIHLPGSDDYVYGSVMLLNNPETVLQNLDEYEGFGNKQPQPYLFVRKLLKIAVGTERVNCWVYLYNLPVEGLAQIVSGNYIADFGI